MQAGLHDAVDQACGEWHKRRHEPQPPPERTGLTANHLVATESAVAVERPRDASASPALMQLKAAMATAGILDLIANHRRLIAPGTEAGGNQRQWRKFH